MRPEYSHLLHRLISWGTAKFKMRIIFVKISSPKSISEFLLLSLTVNKMTQQDEELFILFKV